MKKPRIIIIEDAYVVANFIQAVCSDNGFEVLASLSSGAELTEELLNLKPDLVLLDIILSGDMDGIEVGKKLKERQIPFIFLTAYFDQQTMTRVQTVAPNGFLVKPIHEKKLIKLMNEVLDP